MFRFFFIFYFLFLFLSHDTQASTMARSGCRSSALSDAFSCLDPLRQSRLARRSAKDRRHRSQPTVCACIAAVPLLGYLVSQPLEKRRSRGAGTSSGREHQRCEGAPLHVSNTIFIVTAFVLLVRSVELFRGAVAI